MGSKSVLFPGDQEPGRPRPFMTPASQNPPTASSLYSTWVAGSYLRVILEQCAPFQVHEAEHGCPARCQGFKRTLCWPGGTPETLAQVALIH